MNKSAPSFLTINKYLLDISCLCKVSFWLSIYKVELEWAGVGVRLWANGIGEPSKGIGVLYIAGNEDW